MSSASGGFEVREMREETYADLDGGAKLTHAGGAQSFHGGLEGEGSVEWLMCYRGDGSARYVGLQRFRGTLDGREGSFVVEASGDFDGTASKGTWSVVPASATGDLAGLTGQGGFEAGHGGATYHLEYRLR